MAKKSLANEIIDNILGRANMTREHIVSANVGMEEWVIWSKSSGPKEMRLCVSLTFRKADDAQTFASHFRYDNKGQTGPVFGGPSYVHLYL